MTQSKTMNSAASCLVIMLVYHMGIITDAERTSGVPCTQRCNLRQGFCHEDGSCRHDDLVVKTEGQRLVVIAQSKPNPDDEAVAARCYAGWEGESCEQCTLAPGCVHGTCHMPWQCNCQEGWGGRRCDKDLKSCERNRPCKNGASCINTMGHYVCVCKEGFRGENCDEVIVKQTIQKVESFDSRCNFVGRCIQRDQKQQCTKCKCNAGYAGYFCEINVNECTLRPCANGGRCYDIVNDFYCECVKGFTGRFCSDDIDECQVMVNPCSNNGKCTNTFGSYTCQCEEGFTGPKCQQIIREENEDFLEFVESIQIPVVDVTQEQHEVTATFTPPLHDTSTQMQKVIQGDDIKRGTILTRLTHEIKVSSLDKKDIPLTREELVIQGDFGNRSTETMRVLTFVFMTMAVMVLGIIMLVIWVRFVRTEDERFCCVKTSGSRSRQTKADTPTDDNSVISPMLTPSESNRTDVSHVDESTHQHQQLLPNCNCEHSQNRRSLIQNHEHHQLASPPPPYVQNANDHHQQRLEMPSYYVELPPMSDSSISNFQDYNHLHSNEAVTRRIIV